MAVFQGWNQCSLVRAYGIAVPAYAVSLVAELIASPEVIEEWRDRDAIEARAGCGWAWLRRSWQYWPAAIDLPEITEGHKDIFI